jgi:hypothetical protein
MNGVELARLLKNHDPTLPIVMISGSTAAWEDMPPFVNVPAIRLSQPGRTRALSSKPLRARFVIRN